MTDRTTLTQAEQDFVHAQRVARLATADREGRPHLIPVCYAFDGSRFYTPLDEKPKRVPDAALRRVRNIEVRPEVALLVDRYDDDWSRLGYVLIQGQAEVLHPGDAAHAPALVLLRQRYTQYAEMTLESRQIIAIAPGSVTSWGRLR